MIVGYLRMLGSVCMFTLFMGVCGFSMRFGRFLVVFYGLMVVVYWRYYSYCCRAFHWPKLRRVSRCLNGDSDRVRVALSQKGQQLRRSHYTARWLGFPCIDDPRELEIKTQKVLACVVFGAPQMKSI